MTWVEPDTLRTADLTVLGRLQEASNAALLCDVLDPAGTGEPVGRAIYKPVVGEQPLWDFPDGCLAYREVAAWLISEAGGFGVVPPTVLREGPAGVGSVQLWVHGTGSGSDEDGPEVEEVVDLFAPDALPDGWAPVLEGLGADDLPVVVAHERAADVATMAVLDAVLNNSDRKGAHVLRVGGQLWGFDHGVALHSEDKLRTVLWGWAGEPLDEADRDRVRRLLDALDAPDGPDGAPSLSTTLEPLLTPTEIGALRARCVRLADRGTYPVPSGDWPSVPWPPL